MQVDHESERRALPQRLSVLHVSQPVDGGVGRCVATLARDQVRRGWHVAVASPAEVDAPLEEFLAREVSEAGAEHVRWSARTPPGPWTPLETLRLSSIVRRLRPDVVHLHSSAAGLAGRLAIRGSIPTVFQPNAWSFLSVTGTLRALATKWERAGGRWCSALVCVSTGEREIGERTGIRAPYCVIPNGVDIATPPPDRAAARVSLGIGAAPLVVCVGRLSRQKGQDVLLDAWPKVGAAFPDAELALVGDGPDRDQLRTLASNGVRFAGATTNVEPWLAAADVVAISSRWEGLSITMLEAMAAARSVVSTRVPGADDALDAAAIVPLEDGGALADALVRRLRDPELRAREERANRLEAEASFDVAKVCDRFADLYAQLVGRQ